MRALLLLGEYGRGAPTARDSAPRGAAGAARPALGAPRWGVGGGQRRVRGRLACCRAALCPQRVAPRPAGCARLRTAPRGSAVGAAIR